MNSTMPPPDVSTYVPPGDRTDSTRHPTEHPNRFVRPTRGLRIGGVCAAVADRYGWDRTVVRLVTLLSVLLPGPQVIAYVVAWIVMPGEEDVAAA